MTDDGLVERLRHKAQQSSDIQRQMAEAKSLRQEGHDPPRDDLYMWPTPEHTDEWKAADRLTSLEAELVRRWQPIETAPKDGTNVVLASSERVTFGRWLDNSQTRWPWEGWITPDGPWGPKATKAPTHWMPLPEPPLSLLSLNDEEAAHSAG